MRSSPWCVLALLLSLLVLSNCSGSSGSSGGGGLFSKADPWHTPNYPPHEAAQPAVPPSKFASGPSYDWETSTGEPPGLYRYKFANTRGFAETSAWIKDAMTRYVVGPAPGDPTKYSDFHFDGCTFEWHEEQGLGTTHINAYSYAVNLAHVGLYQILAYTDMFRVAWREEKNVRSESWENEAGHWTDLGERIETSTRRDFPVPDAQTAAKLAAAFVHAARLCGAPIPE